jgi:RNA polymerase-binding transcription factor DksA
MDTERARELLEQRMAALRDVAGIADEQVRLDRNLVVEETVTTEAAELAVETAERELDMTIREAAEASLHDVERALQRLAKGTYGICPVCTRPIADERLEAKPEAEYCIDHQPR